MGWRSPTASGPLVLEYIDGPTLADRIARGPIPVEEALAIAKQICEALEAAHEQGVIHRDLKPANIKLKPDGTVKVLDFGLAKALDRAPEGDPNQSPTLTAAATQMGVIMGTAAYMAPEQARGKLVDRRADIWAFGCVLYEMLTGRRAFEGEDISLTMSAVLQREPDWTRIPDELGPGLRTYLLGCLQKDPRQRIQAIGDVRLALLGVFDTPTTPFDETAEPAGLAFWQRPAQLLVGGLMLAAVIWYAASAGEVPNPPRCRPYGHFARRRDRDELELGVSGCRHLADRRSGRVSNRPVRKYRETAPRAAFGPAWVVGRSRGRAQ